MSVNTGEPTTETVVANEMPDGDDDYVPVFNAATRKWAYLVSGLVGIAGAVLSFVSAVPDGASWMAVMGGACSLVGSGVAGMFGVHYAGISK